VIGGRTEQFIAHGIQTAAVLPPIVSKIEEGMIIMNLKFADSMDGDLQNRACGILLSLSMLSDAARRMVHSSGCMRCVYESELKHHYDRIVLDTLRLLAISMHNLDIVSDANVAYIRDAGHMAFANLLDQYEECFDTDTESE